jgi:hypothetical protein
MRAPAVLAGIVALVTACGDGGKTVTAPDSSAFGSMPASVASCGASSELYSALPVAQENIGGWVPLGAMNPSGHTFPTDHQYIYLKSFGPGSITPVDVVAPAAVTIVGARRTQYGSPATFEDFSIMFSACRDTWVEFGHLRAIAPGIVAQLPPFDQGCNSYSPSPGQVVTACWTRASDIKVSAGEVIGTTAGLDLWMFDARIAPLTFANPARWGGMSSGFDHFHVVPFSDYYTEPMRGTVQSMLGSFDGKVKRTIAPLGGTIASDVAGTVQGAWFFGAAPTYPEYPHLAISPNHVDPTRIEISMGISGGAFASGLRAMLPSAAGPFNRHPALITPGTAVHCWDLINAGDLGPGYGVALIQLVDATTLKIEGRLGPQFSCANQQAAVLTSAAVTFRR